MRLLIVALLVVRVAIASVIRVPDNATTIQQALDLLSNGDTVLVAGGVYAEALNAPPLEFHLIGSASVDSGWGDAPYVDPTILEGSDTLACLRLPSGSRAVIERMAFRNGAGMFPRDLSFLRGGIVCSSDSVVLRQCLFDSTSMGIASSRNELEGCVELTECHFVNNPNGCAIVPRFRMTATVCEFSGRGWKLVTSGDSSVISGCRFHGNDQGYLLTAFGAGVVIEYCHFGPRGAHPFAVVDVGGTGARVYQNLFNGCETGSAVLAASVECPGDVVYVCRNSFYNNRVSVGQGTAGLAMQCDSHPSPPPDMAIIDSNYFADSEGHILPKCVKLSVGTHIRANRFERIHPAEPPTVGWGEDATIVLRRNIFRQTTMGVARISGFDSETDARYNYWGHASGPYHTILNPDGLGDGVGDFVDFIPWYPDTSFLAVPEPPRLLPERFALTAYPNPFNAAVRLRLDVAAAGIYEIIVFDLLGRRIAKIWQGPAVGFTEAVFDGRALPAGIYFAQAREIPGGCAVATTKLVLLK